MASLENTSIKRQRDETQNSKLEETKKQKSFNLILSILDDDEEEPTQDLSSLITNLQQELCSGAGIELSDQIPTDPEDNLTEINVNSGESSSESSVSNEEDDKERVMRHLLEASDDELGIPTAVHGGAVAGEVVGGGGDGFVVFDKLWEFEDESANCFTFLESEL